MEAVKPIMTRDDLLQQKVVGESRARMRGRRDGMIALYVTKEWLDDLPRVSEMIVFREPEGKYYSLLAGKTQVDGLFVRTELARREVIKRGNVFIHCMIPVNVVGGAFDLTIQEEKEYGFKGGNEKG